MREDTYEPLWPSVVTSTGLLRLLMSYTTETVLSWSIW